LSGLERSWGRGSALDFIVACGDVMVSDIDEWVEEILPRDVDGCGIYAALISLAEVVTAS